MTNLFLRMILNMRKEEIMLYDNLFQISDAEAQEVIYFLELEYKGEMEDYPFSPPPFDEQAALWGAKTIYFAAQLILYRENQPEDLELLIPSYTGTSSPSAILSVDLSLRFMPHIMKHLKLLDPEDALIEVLEKLLKTWHYSAIGYDFETSDFNFDVIKEHATLKQLYINRVIERKATSAARIPLIQTGIRAALGLHSKQLWPDFEFI